MKILVTGGAGFIGSNYIGYFLRRHPECSVFNLDKLTYAANLENLAEVASQPNYKFVKGDICDVELVASLFDQSLDAVVHFAAESHVDRSIADAREFICTNVLGTYTLLEAARRKRVARFIHVSTDEVYGSLQPEDSANEQAPVRPNSPYAASKAASDLLVRSYWQTHRFPAIITRSSNNYGPRQFPEKLIPLIVTNALEAKRLPVYGDGMNERDWIFVEDHCRALDRVLFLGRPGETYNIGSGQPVTNLEIVRKVLRILDKSDDLIEFVADRLGHDRRYSLHTDKIRDQLDWKPIVGIDEGLTRTVQWYRAHGDWVNRAKSGEYRAYYEKFYERRTASLAEL